MIDALETGGSMLNRGFMVAVLLSLAPLSARPLAAVPHWAPVGPYGGRIDTLTVDPTAPQVLYATSADQGAFKSTDGGATWRLIHTGPVNGNVAVDPAQPTTLYQAFNLNQVLKSTDGGATWRASSKGLAKALIGVTAVDPARHARVFVAGNGVWRSLDGGASWSPAQQGLPKGFAGHVNALELAPGPAGILYAATDDGVFKSLDAGSSWMPARQGLPAGDEVLALAPAPANPQILWASLLTGGVFRSTDGGASWSATANPPATLVISLAVDPGDPSAATAGTVDHGIYRTTDAGAHWTPVGPRATAEVPAVAATATSVYAGIVPDYLDPGGVLASSDGGATWQPRNTGLHALATFDLAIDPRHAESLWAAAGVTGLFQSSTGGLTWDLSAQPPAPPFDPLSLPLNVGAALSADAAHLYTVFDFGLWASGDDGASWGLLLGAGTTPADASIASVRTHPADASTVYAQGFHMTYGSHDSGATWQTVGRPGFGCAIAGIALAPSAPATLYALGSNISGFNRCGPVVSVSRSTDGGASWTQADAALKGSRIFSLAVDPLDARTVYAQTSRSLMKSTDGGVTWSRAGKSTSGELLFSADGGILWEARGKQVFASHNGGATWQSLGGPQSVVQRLIADPSNPDRLYAATAGGVWVFQ
jgi:photosystem II stability/assembly factor-like uncharacterized protein